MTARCIECGIDAEEVRRLRARVKDLEQKVAETRSTEANERTVSWQHAADCPIYRGTECACGTEVP